MSPCASSWPRKAIREITPRAARSRASKPPPRCRACRSSTPGRSATARASWLTAAASSTSPPAARRWPRPRPAPTRPSPRSTGRRASAAGTSAGARSPARRAEAGGTRRHDRQGRQAEGHRGAWRPSAGPRGAALDRPGARRRRRPRSRPHSHAGSVRRTGVAAQDHRRHLHRRALWRGLCGGPARARDPAADGSGSRPAARSPARAHRRPRRADPEVPACAAGAPRAAQPGAGAGLAPAAGHAAGDARPRHPLADPGDRFLRAGAGRHHARAVALGRGREHRIARAVLARRARGARPDGRRARQPAPLRHAQGRGGPDRGDRRQRRHHRPRPAHAADALQRHHLVVADPAAFDRAREAQSPAARRLHRRRRGGIFGAGLPPLPEDPGGRRARAGAAAPPAEAHPHEPSRRNAPRHPA